MRDVLVLNPCIILGKCEVLKQIFASIDLLKGINTLFSGNLFYWPPPATEVYFAHHGYIGGFGVAEKNATPKPPLSHGGIKKMPSSTSIYSSG